MNDEQSTDYGDNQYHITVNASGHHINEGNGAWNALITFMLLAFLLAIIGGIALAVVGLFGMAADVLFMLAHLLRG